MKFGKTWEDFQKEPAGGDGTNYLRALKEGDTVVQFLTEPEEWIGYYEHFNPTPGGYSFPCTQESDCPGCNSDSEKMKGRTRKVAFTCMVDGKWINVYKVPKKYAEKVARRQERTGTLLDREYILTRTGKGTDTDYDIESGDKVALPTAVELPDVQQMLVELYEQTWGGDDVFTAKEAVELKSDKLAERTTMTEALKASTKPKIDDDEYSESELRGMKPAALRKLAKANDLTIPDDVDDEDADAIVDWMIKVQEDPPF